ncbi:MAG: prepilin-type N-terminal cleavage/methylation domain-containing protein [Desulfobacterales bacterium]|nr:prepilin-type N-terminal cleavage/methylation domain-containing protein [Desulfobacterales bacterium]
MPYQASNPEAGMTLIEVMVALIIFVIGVLGLASLQIASIRSNAKAFDMTEAILLISDRAESLIEAPWSKTEMDAHLAAGNHSASPSQSPFTITWTVTDGPSPLRQKNIALKVSWNEGTRSHIFTQSLIKNRR